VTQSTVNGAPPIAQVALPACSPFSTGITPGAGGSYDATTGVLDLRGGGTVTLDSPGPYCFSAVMLRRGSTLAISGDTTIDMTGTITSSGGRFLTGGAALAINSSATTSSCFREQRRQHDALRAFARHHLLRAAPDFLPRSSATRSPQPEAPPSTASTRRSSCLIPAAPFPPMLPT